MLRKKSRPRIRQLNPTNCIRQSSSDYYIYSKYQNIPCVHSGIEVVTILVGKQVINR